MNKKVKLILQGLLFIAIIVGFIYIGTRDFSEKVVVDNERFDADYTNVSKDNVFKYVNAVETYAALKKDAIIFMGYPANVWSGYYANILNEAAKDSGIKEILYYDFYDDRENRNGTYQSIVLSLSNYLVMLDDGTEEIYAPTLVIVKDGKVIAFDNETAFTKGNITPEFYWDEYQTGIKYNNFKTMFAEYLKWKDYLSLLVLP